MAPTNYEDKLPVDIMTKLKSNIRNLFNHKRVCGVCLNNTRNLRLGDTIYSISCGENLTEKCLREILCSTFGYKVTTLLPTSYFCEHCIDVILKAYRMLEEIKFNHHILQYYSNKLIEQTKMPLPDDVQSIVFELDYPNNSKFENYKNEIANSNVNNGGYISSDFDSEDEDDSNDRFCIPEIKTEQTWKQEPNNLCSGKLITLEISEIVAKIKDQITFKKLKADTKHGKFDDSKETENIKSKNARKASANCKIIGKRKTGPNKTDKSPKNRYYKCYLCETTFTGESELLKHSRKQCIEPGNLGMKHMKRIGLKKTIKKEDSTKKEVCDQCGKLIASNYLRKHKRLHEKIQKQCTVCAQFINKTSFNKHMLSHSGLPRMRSCPHCDYESKYSEALDAHINKEHLHIRPYTCAKCGKGFHSKLLLREHVKIHTRLKTEQCHLCGDRFAYKKSLMLHMRLHTGFAPYKCHLCDESFISASRRQTHVQSKHMARTLQCDLCLKKFSLRTTLRTHMIKIHQRKDKVKNSS